MEEMTTQPVTRDLVVTLTVAVDSWVKNRYESKENGIEIPGADVDCILNGLINFSASKVAMVHTQLIKLGVLEKKEEDVSAFNARMIELYTAHFNRVLVNNMTEKTDERTDNKE